MKYLVTHTPQDADDYKVVVKCDSFDEAMSDLMVNVYQECGENVTLQLTFVDGYPIIVTPAHGFYSIVQRTDDDQQADYTVGICPACGDPIDYCQGHGTLGDSAGAEVLERHDEGDHRQCHPKSWCKVEGR